MKLNVNINSSLTHYVNLYRKCKCVAWYITKCVQYCNENGIDVYEYYEVLDSERTDKTKEKGNG